MSSISNSSRYFFSLGKVELGRERPRDASSDVNIAIYGRARIAFAQLLLSFIVVRWIQCRFANAYSANPRAEDAAANENVFGPVRQRESATIAPRTETGWLFFSSRDNQAIESFGTKSSNNVFLKKKSFDRISFSYSFLISTSVKHLIVRS